MTSKKRLSLAKIYADPELSMFHAIETNEYDLLSSLLSCHNIQNPEDEPMTDNEESLLFYAFKMYQETKDDTIFKLLLKHGANLFFQGENNNTIIHLLAENNEYSLLDFILRSLDKPTKTKILETRNCRISKVVRNENVCDTPLHSAIFNGHCEAALTLLQHGSNLLSITDRYTPLGLANLNIHKKEKKAIFTMLICLTPNHNLDVEIRGRDIPETITNIRQNKSKALLHLPHHVFKYLLPSVNNPKRQIQTIDFNKEATHISEEEFKLNLRLSVQPWKPNNHHLFPLTLRKAIKEILLICHRNKTAKSIPDLPLEMLLLIFSNLGRGDFQDV